MSLVGIDVGSSATKIAAYREDGSLLAIVRVATSPNHPNQGYWELEPDSVWRGAFDGLSRLVGRPIMRKNPPKAIAISASGREAFPVDANGRALGPCIMAGDTRQSGLEESVAAELDAKTWFNAVGHLPERMDPVFRLMWWRRNRPLTIKKARYFLGWHEFFSLRLTGRAVTDRGLASKWLTFDLQKRRWSSERLARFRIDESLLPEIQPWGTIIGALKREVATKLNLRGDVRVGVGGFDASCSALGAGVSEFGTGCLLSGTWEDIIVPVTFPVRKFKFVEAGFSVSPHPGSAGAAIFALSPNGTSVVDWTRKLLGLRHQDVDKRLAKSGPGPSPVMAIPHLSGATVPWTHGERSRGAFLGLTLATTSTDIVKSIMESVAYDLSHTLAMLGQQGVKPRVLRGTGGGVHSEWWTQLKADLSGIPIELVNQTEPGTLGAAMLGGLAAGLIDNLDEKLRSITKVERRVKNNPGRMKLHRERLQSYETAVADLLQSAWSKRFSS